jgi:predicted CoA-binding protein
MTAANIAPNLPPAVAAFLAGRRIVVAGVSRTGKAPANAILRRLRECGHEAIPVNPNAAEIDGEPCWPSVTAVPGDVHAVMIATAPAVALDVARAALDRGIRHLWFHRSFGGGSVADDAVAECRRRGVEPIVGGCPLMYCGRIDPVHRVFRWWLRRQGRVPG